jgi:DNA repair exonuclease SbcCD ATPase subunit
LIEYFLPSILQFAELELTHAEATQRLARMSELEKERKQDETLQHELRARIAELDDLTRSKDDVIEALKDEKEALATSKDEVIRTLEGEKEALATSKDDVIKSLEVEKEALAKSKVDIVATLEAEKEALARSKDDLIRALEGEKEAVVFEALDRLEEADALTDRVQALLEEQDRALKAFREEATAGDEELTRVRQRLVEVEQALVGSQEELRTSKMEGEGKMVIFFRPPCVEN